MTIATPNIFEYIDYRKYLADWYTSRKSADPSISHASICHQLGQPNAKSYFNNVVSARRDVSSAFIDRFIQLLQLKADEAKYFRAMVNFNQTSSAQEKEFFFDQLVRLNNTPQKFIDKSAYAYFKEWYHSAIRALLDITDFTNDYQLLAASLNPPITVKQARESIALLKTLGLVTPSASGILKPTDKVVTTGDYAKDYVIKQYQMKCLDHAKEVLASDVNAATRTIVQTISMSDEAYQRIMSRIQQLKTEIRSIVHKDDKKATRVYQLSLTMYPQTR